MLTYDAIPGWFDFQDIYQQAVDEASDGAVLVEVGTWLGRSAAFLANEIKQSGKRLSFFCVDTFQGTPAEVGVYDVDNVYLRWLANMQACGVTECVKPLVMTSELASEFFAANSLDFVFIDADHSYDAVRKDIGYWLPKVKPGGVIAGHDLGHEGVALAVKERFPDAVCRVSSWWHRVL